MAILKITEFGNPILREHAKQLSITEVKSKLIQQLIMDMQDSLLKKKLGIGLAAPQVGKSLAISVIEIQKTDARPDVEKFSLVIVNPKIIRTFGNKRQMWEGCISCGPSNSSIFAKVPRYKKIEVEYLDVKGVKQKGTFKELTAHVIQHEVDHLHGILFVDKVKDTKSYMSYKEYKKMAKSL